MCHYRYTEDWIELTCTGYGTTLENHGNSEINQTSHFRIPMNSTVFNSNSEVKQFRQNSVPTEFRGHPTISERVIESATMIEIGFFKDFFHTKINFWIFLMFNLKYGFFYLQIILKIRRFYAFLSTNIQEKYNKICPLLYKKNFPMTKITKFSTKTKTFSKANLYAFHIFNWQCVVLGKMFWDTGT